jgi:RNA polymerase sigma-70 factor (ECF subfamily)
MLRYLDGLPVPEVARHLDRTVHATEALLVRARAAFRRIYEGEAGSR